MKDGRKLDIANLKPTGIEAILGEVALLIRRCSEAVAMQS
jgi:hypothetical protein